MALPCENNETTAYYRKLPKVARDFIRAVTTPGLARNAAIESLYWDFEQQRRVDIEEVING